MVSGFMTPGGNLQLPADPFRECTQIFEPTQEGEYLPSALMGYQLQYLAIPLSEAQWPGHQALSFFDNAASHIAFSLNALRVANMNLSSGGNRNHNMRDGWDPLTQQPQPMYTWIRGRKVGKDPGGPVRSPSQAHFIIALDTDTDRPLPPIPN